ncbi:anti-repressor SinI family protein [Jeotgalibacillus soli]|uniref:Sin domain-containing protein n=1 Tax=Jeotgalibacillus soli TaxID=889306 RepID=A0A0C2VVZ4_9BACL|nr:anti-repressor SinI family protein [Jeotgalibacillus soli]KIL48158.1 hypothetical protein KP78_16050 [Jeotgalibacillus soli]
MGQQQELDMEWVALIKEALGVGITETEIYDFFKGSARENDYKIRRICAR